MSIYSFLKKTVNHVNYWGEISLILNFRKLFCYLLHSLSHIIDSLLWLLRKAIHNSFFLLVASFLTCAVTASGANFIETNPCPFTAGQAIPEDRLKCGTLTVPENREKPQLGSLALPVAIIKTTSTAPARDPIVFLSGGPGASVTSSPRNFQLFAKHLFGANRDIILMTQRGGFMTKPSLACGPLSNARKNIYLEDHTLPERDAAITETAKACLLALQASGRDLKSYTAVNNALDFKTLRKALGIPKWNLFGVSYGTYIALEIARHDKEGVRSMVLDSLVSMESDLFMSETAMNFSNAIKLVMSACRADQACHHHFPSAANKLQTIHSDLRKTPKKITVEGPNGPLVMHVNWHDFLGLLHWMLYSAKTIPFIPLLLEETANGNVTLITALMNKVFPAPMNNEPSAAGAFFAVVCADQYTRRAPLRLAGSGDFDGFSITSFMEQLCSDPKLPFGNKPAPKPVISDIPTILLSGKFDPITPLHYAKDVQKGLTNSSLIRIQNYGHSTLSGYTECQTHLASAFLNDLEPKDQEPCLASIPPISFVTSLETAYEMLGISDGS